MSLDSNKDDTTMTTTTTTTAAMTMTMPAMMSVTKDNCTQDSHTIVTCLFFP
jgi:hypothetical protein